MNKISFFILLALVYLGLSKSFSPSEVMNHYVQDERVYGGHFKGAPVEVILIDSFKIGFLIKTYFHKYRIVYGFHRPEEKIIRISKRFYERSKDQLGLSLFRRDEKEKKESIAPSYPGSLYVGDLAYGTWELQDSGLRTWVFHRAYRFFPSYFNWGDFSPSQEFHAEAKAKIDNSVPFFGQNNEFGTKGNITSKILERYSFASEEVSLKRILKKHFALPWIQHKLEDI
jgi:hypothetical protein